MHDITFVTWAVVAFLILFVGEVTVQILLSKKWFTERDQDEGLHNAVRFGVALIAIPWPISVFVVGVIAGIVGFIAGTFWLAKGSVNFVIKKLETKGSR